MDTKRRKTALAAIGIGPSDHWDLIGIGAHMRKILAPTAKPVRVRTDPPRPGAPPPAALACFMRRLEAVEPGLVDIVIACMPSITTIQEHSDAYSRVYHLYVRGPYQKASVLRLYVPTITALRIIYTLPPHKRGIAMPFSRIAALATTPGARTINWWRNIWGTNRDARDYLALAIHNLFCNGIRDHCRHVRAHITKKHGAARLRAYFAAATRYRNSVVKKARFVFSYISAYGLHRFREENGIPPIEDAANDTWAMVIRPHELIDSAMQAAPRQGDSYYPFTAHRELVAAILAANRTLRC